MNNVFLWNVLGLIFCNFSAQFTFCVVGWAVISISVFPGIFLKDPKSSDLNCSETCDATRTSTFL